MHHSKLDQPLGNAPGRAPAAQTWAKETQLFSCLNYKGVFMRTGCPNDPARIVHYSQVLTCFPLPARWIVQRTCHKKKIKKIVNNCQDSKFLIKGRVH